MKKPFSLKSRKTVNNRYWYYKLKDEGCYHSTGFIDDGSLDNKEKVIKYIEDNILTKRKFKIINQEKIKEYLFYNNCDGQFYWKKDICNNAKKGEIAGYILNNYQMIKIEGITYSVNRLVWIYFNKVIKDGYIIDHIDHNSLNNRIENLREVSIAENNLNRSKPKNNKSGCVGVFWDKRKNKWLAKIGINHKVIEIGSFLLLDEAIRARKDAEIKYGFHSNHGS